MQPFSFRADAVHRQMPELPPVTITTLLFSPTMISPPENVDLVRVYRIAGAAVYTDSRIVEKYRDQLAQIFTQIGLSFLHSQCQLALEIEMLRKYTILAILYKLDQKSVCQLTIKDIPELKCAAESKPYEDENEIR